MAPNNLYIKDIHTICGSILPSHLEEKFQKLVSKKPSPLIGIAIKVRNYFDIRTNYGFGVANCYIERLTKKIKILLRNAHLIIYLYPDIFVVLIKSKIQLNRLAEKIYGALQGPLAIEGSYLPIKILLSVCELPQNINLGKMLEVMIHSIEDTTIEERYTTRKYENEINNLKQGLSTYLSISRKIAIGEVAFALQPIYSTNRLSLAFYEVLARLVTKKGILTPNKFMGTVEKLKLKLDLERVILYKTLYYKNKHTEISKISINISIDYLFERLNLDLKQYFKEFSIDPEKIIFELIEQPSQHHYNRKKIYKILDKLKDQGFGIALDDFGLYHSNFSLLKEFPWDLVKIDGNFIKTILNNKFDQKLLEFLSEIAIMRGFKLVAEYVENKKQADLLKKIGIHYLQGFLLGHPKIIEESLHIIPPLVYKYPI